MTVIPEETITGTCENGYDVYCKVEDDGSRRRRSVGSPTGVVDMVS